MGRSIREGVKSNRELSDKQARLVKNWQLGNACGNGLLLCNLKRAEDTLRRYFLTCGVDPSDLSEQIFYCAISLKLRDALGMVVYNEVSPGCQSNRVCVKVPSGTRVFQNGPFQRPRTEHARNTPLAQ